MEFYKFEERERKLYIEILKTILDGILKDTSLSISPLYVTGGTCRRLFLLENNHPMTFSDVVGIFQSDIDVHSSTYSMHSGSFMDSIFGLTVPVFTGSGNPYDSFALCEIPLGYNYKAQDKKTLLNLLTNQQNHIISKISPLLNELEKYRGKLFDNNYDIIREIRDMTIQYIRISNVNFSDAKLLTRERIENFHLPFDINSSMFVYWNGELFDKRKYKDEDPHKDYLINLIDINVLKSLVRVKKLESYGYTFDMVDIRKQLVNLFDAINESKDNYSLKNGNIIKSYNGLISSATLDCAIENDEYIDRSLNIFDNL